MPGKLRVAKCRPMRLIVSLSISLIIICGISGWQELYGASNASKAGDSAPSALPANVDRSASDSGSDSADADSPDALPSPTATAFGGADATANIEPGQAIVMLDENLSGEQATGLLAALPCVGDSIDVSAIDLGCAAVALAPGISVEQGIAQLEQQPFVRAAQPNHVYRLTDGAASNAPATQAAARSLSVGVGTQAQAPDDPEADRTTGRQRSALEAIRAYDAWELSRTDGSVTIAVLDTGCDMDHPDLQNNLIKADAYDVIRGTSAVIDTTGHGTHVAGIAAADANNGAGIAGASFNARVLPICAIDSSGRTNSAYVLRGLAYVEKVRAAHPEYNLRVINMSFGGKATSPDSGDAAVISAIDQLADEGVLCVCAAGNTDEAQGEIPPYRSWPGDFSDNILQVGNASTISASTPTLAKSSNFNTPGQMTKLVCAPGTDIYSTVPGGTHNGDDSDFAAKSGTSMASPCAAGIAALVFAANPQLTPAQVAGILCSTATDMCDAGFDEPSGFGMIDACAAVQAARNGVWLDGARSMLVGASTTLSPSPAASASGDLSWSSSRPDVARVDSTGTVTGIAPGYTAISARGTGVSLSQVVIVHEAQISGASDLKVGQSATLSVSESRSALGAAPAGIWNWESSNPAVAAINDSGRARGIAPGTAKVSAALSSDPTVRISRAITVVPASTSIESARVEGIDAAYTYTGSIIMPRPTVTLGSSTLLLGTAYTLSYRNNLDIGTATITITGKGDFSGSITRTFKIVSAAAMTPEKPAPSEPETVTLPKKAQSLKVVSVARSVKYAKVKKRAVSTAKVVRISGAKGKVTFIKVSGSKRLSIGKTTGKATVKKGTPRGTYKMRVRVRAAGNARYRPASRAVTVRVRVK